MIKTNNGLVSCPQCRHEQKAESATQFVINYGIEEILLADPTPPPAPEPKVPSVAGPEYSAGVCEEHLQHQLFRCNTHREWICMLCTVVKHPTGVCSVVEIKKAVADMKDDARNEISSQVGACHETLETLDLYDEELNDQVKAHRSLLTEQEGVMASYKEAVEDLQMERGRAKKVREEGFEVRQNLETVRSRLTDTKTLQEVQDCRRDARHHQAIAQNWTGYHRDNFPKQDIISRAKKVKTYLCICRLWFTLKI